MYRPLIAIFLFFLCTVQVYAQSTAISPTPSSAYEEVARQIIRAALADSLAYERTAYLADTFGPRLSGSENLERAIEWILDEMRADGLDNVRGEPVMVPHWVRGQETLQMIEPRAAEMQVLGLGGSIGTPRDGITAQVLVVKSFKELEERREEAQGKIVVYNAPFASYGQTVQYRYDGASRAAEAGAVACLVRSITDTGFDMPHTGSMGYEEGIPRIPSAAITVSDALMLQRMQDRGQKITLRLYMEARTMPDVQSQNVIAELTGSESPDEIVVLGGHIDSWDVGQGAMDDAGGCIAAWEAVRLLKSLGLKPRRTIRVVMWTNEENGLQGALHYRDDHQHELDQHVLALETDSGVFKPEGFGFSGTDSAFTLIKDIGSMLETIDAGNILRGGGGADISPLMRAGIPGMGLFVDGTEYFKHHHSASDTIDKLDPHEMNLCVAAMAVMAYVVADMPERLPRTYLPATN